MLELTRTDDGAELNATHRRMNWYPQTTKLARTEDDLTGRVTYRPADYLYPAGTKDVADLLDSLDVPPDMSIRKVEKFLRSHGQGRRRNVITGRRSAFPKGPRRSAWNGRVTPPVTPF